jgi:hypothetical protein
LKFENEELNGEMEPQVTAAVDATDGHVDLVSALEIMVCRGLTAAYINRKNLAVQLAMPSNGDTLVAMSSPGVAYYLLGYITKAQDDGLLSTQRMLQALKFKLQNQDLNATPHENGISTIVSALLSATSTQDVSSAMAAWLIGSGHKSRAVFSHEFENIYVKQVAAYISGGAVDVSLLESGMEGSRKAQLPVMPYRHRGVVLEDLSYFEQSIWYVLKDINGRGSGLPKKPADVAARSRRAMQEQSGDVERDEGGAVCVRSEKDCASNIFYFLSLSTIVQ